uniref:uncharacterized protein LOC105351422 isoform X1 n=1 Tax=Fragaria vesca subsp. vesca TaxID=101020 RepID=UPI0005CA2066|nr:PREDICTED: uncharacterized protein LOC105351422 isoform X1 [Fragaria vesca subsp. vesca]
MELKGVSLVVMMILLITGTAMAVDDCVGNCLKDCHCLKGCPNPISRACVENCRSRCPPELVVDETSKGHNRHHQYCIGCLHHCEKYRDDKKKMGKCIHHCETHCNIKAPSPSLGPISSPSDLSPSPSPSFE